MDGERLNTCFLHVIRTPGTPRRENCLALHSREAIDCFIFVLVSSNRGIIYIYIQRGWCCHAYTFVWGVFAQAFLSAGHFTLQGRLSIGRGWEGDQCCVMLQDVWTETMTSTSCNWGMSSESRSPHDSVLKCVSALLQLVGINTLNPPAVFCALDHLSR